MKSVLLTLVVSFHFTLMSAQHSLERVWETDSVFQFCEGIALDAGGEFLYVSNTIGNPMEKDGKGSISKVSLDGKVINLDWVTSGMNAPKDIQVFKNLIYIADLDEVLVIDADQSKITQRIHIDGTTLLHNIAIDTNGIVYVSDLFAGKVYRIEDGKPTLYIDNLGYAAGLLSLGTDLYVLTAGNLIKVDKNKKMTTISTGMDHRMNGIQMVNDKEFVVTSWGGIMYYINADGTNQVLLDTRDKHIPCGIIYVHPKSKVIYMSSDQHNILYAFTIK
ncbi:MAG: hypothetical protein ACK5HZ_03680 [Macellibacteroides fermentans]|uniref:hypothetical protein n=1 Tax=Macellibacteroides fermentans TaxID=879969 RepID=UPI003AC716A6